MSRSVCSEPLMMLVTRTTGTSAWMRTRLAHRPHRANAPGRRPRACSPRRSGRTDGHQTSHRRGGHDRAATARLHGATRRCDAVDDAIEVDGHRAPVGLGVEVVTHAAPRRDADVEVGDMQPAERLDRERDGGRAGGGIRDVGPDEPTLELVGDCLVPGRRRCRRSRRGPHGRPGAGRRPRRCRCCSAGDEQRPCRRRRVPCARSGGRTAALSRGEGRGAVGRARC